MLKIRDDINLKELEKYGLKKKVKSKQIMYVWQNKYSINVIEIDIHTREITNLGDKNGNVILYDLIKDGLVEKVDE